MNLDEAISAFRDLTEGVKVGDYVTAADGRCGYVQVVQNGMVSFRHSDYDSGENVTLPADVLTVNPSKRMAEGFGNRHSAAFGGRSMRRTASAKKATKRCPPGFKMIFGTCLKLKRGGR
jgi:hypothetical protein